MVHCTRIFIIWCLRGKPFPLREATATRATAPLCSAAPIVRGNTGHVRISVRTLEAKGLVVVSRTRGGKAEALALTREGNNRSALYRKV